MYGISSCLYDWGVAWPGKFVTVACYTAGKLALFPMARHCSILPPFSLGVLLTFFIKDVFEQHAGGSLLLARLLLNSNKVSCVAKLIPWLASLPT